MSIYFVHMKKTLLSYILLASFGVNAQVSSVKHVVTKGETLTQIAKKHEVSVQSIITLNPGAADGIQEYQVLLIPKNNRLEHVVQPKETVFGISKKYNIAIEKLQDLNPGLKENGLKIGQKLVLADSSIANQSNNISNTYEVKAKETVYAIAVQNGITVSELYELNPGLESSGLKEGQILKLPTKQNTVQKSSSSQQKATELQGFFTIEVEPKQTLYNIQRTYGVTAQQLMLWNPELQNGLKEGMVLKIEKSNNNASLHANQSAPVAQNPSKVDYKFDQFSNNSSKEMVILMPFNLKQNDPNSSTIHSKISNDVFLNMILDFYAGVQLALDEIQNKNFPLTIHIVDSEESNRAMNIEQLKNKFDFNQTDVIIGPFFQKNVDALSKAFEGTSTVIVSPLSTEKGQPFPNQVHTMPSEDLLKSELIAYLESKNEHVLWIQNPKDKNKNQQYIQRLSNTARIETNTKGNITKSLLTPHLNKQKTNYVILDTSDLTTTIETVYALRDLRKQYDIQLVVLERGANLDSTDVSINDLAELRMIFPSVTNEANSSKREVFYQNFRRKFRKNPTKFSVRGYDVVMDMVNRMHAGIDGNIFEYGSQQIENKFTYINEAGGIYNSGVYILQYNPDLTITEAN